MGAYRSIDLQQEVVGGLAGAQGEVHDAVDAELRHVRHALATEVLAELHAEGRREVALVAGVRCRMEAHPRLEHDEHLLAVFPAAGALEEVRLHDETRTVITAGWPHWLE